MSDPNVGGLREVSIQKPAYRVLSVASPWDSLAL